MNTVGIVSPPILPVTPVPGSVLMAVAAFKTIAAEAQNAAAALQGTLTPAPGGPPIMAAGGANGSGASTRGLPPLDPGSFAPGGSPTAGGAPQSNGSSSSAPGGPSRVPSGAVPPASVFTADELAVLQSISDLIKGETPQLSSTDKTVAAQAQKNIGILCAYATGILEGRGYIRLGTFAAKLAPQPAGDLASQANHVSEYLDGIIADPTQTRIVPILVGVIIGMGIMGYIATH